MTDLLYTAKELSDKIKKPDIIYFINIYLKEMENERLITTIIPLSDYSNHDILDAKKLLENNGFKVVLMKDPNHNELMHSLIIALPKN